MNRTTRSIVAVSAGAAAALVAILAVAPLIGGPWVDRVVRERLAAVARDRFESSVTVEHVAVSLLPPSATMTGVVFRHRSRNDVPPLFEIDRMEIRGGLGILAPAPRASSVRLAGLRIVIPRGNDSAQPESEPANPNGASPNYGAAEVIADGAQLRVLSKKPGREPLEFDLQMLRMRDVSLADPMKYTARLTNPKPPGLIHSAGEFGPWNGPDPTLTPLQGIYELTDADLSDFKGLRGILRSNGRFQGLLEEIVVDGEADVPRFALEISGNPVHLKTQFHAIVDGTNGDTRLEPVNAQFLKSSVVARGAIEGREGVKGKGVSLDVRVRRARIEDMLRLAMRGGKPLLRGPIRFQTRLDLPPGQGDVIERLRLNGAFEVENGKFQQPAIQDKIDSLSRKGLGEPENAAIDDVSTGLAGSFRLASGIIRFRQLSFEVPGVGVRLDGAFDLRDESVDLTGTLRMDAKVSETVTGFRSVLLKAVDPLFGRRKAGAVVPIKISGTRSKPEFGLDAAGLVKRDE
ncbi:MAG: AsmA-like C-terminal region-containing protein [Bryobacteraceae bacterium]